MVRRVCPLKIGNHRLRTGRFASAAPALGARAAVFSGNDRGQLGTESTRRRLNKTLKGGLMLGCAIVEPPSRGQGSEMPRTAC
jgi:hypothetical protein